MNRNILSLVSNSTYAAKTVGTISGRAEADLLLDGAIAVLNSSGATIDLDTLESSGNVVLTNLTETIGFLVGAQSSPKGVNLFKSSMVKLGYTAPVAKVYHIGSNGTSGNMAWDTPFANRTSAGIIVNNIENQEGEKRYIQYNVELTSNMTEEQAVDALVAKINANTNSIVTAAKVTQSTNFGISLTGKDNKNFTVTTDGELKTTAITLSTAYVSGFGTKAQMQEMIDFCAPKMGDRGGLLKYDGYTPTVATAASHVVYELKYYESRIDEMQSFGPAMLKAYNLIVPSSYTTLIAKLDKLMNAINAIALL